MRMNGIFMTGSIFPRLLALRFLRCEPERYSVPGRVSLIRTSGASTLVMF